VSTTGRFWVSTEGVDGPLLPPTGPRSPLLSHAGIAQIRHETHNPAQITKQPDPKNQVVFRSAPANLTRRSTNPASLTNPPSLPPENQVHITCAPVVLGGTEVQLALLQQPPVGVHRLVPGQRVNVLLHMLHVPPLQPPHKRLPRSTRAPSRYCSPGRKRWCWCPTGRCRCSCGFPRGTPRCRPWRWGCTPVAQLAPERGPGASREGGAVTRTLPILPAPRGGGRQANNWLGLWKGFHYGGRCQRRGGGPDRRQPLPALPARTPGPARRPRLCRLLISDDRAALADPAKSH
jgi:hypothetical protein